MKTEAETQAEKQTEKEYHLAILCEVCAEPLRLITMQDDKWLAECSDGRCRTLHRGAL